MRPRASRALQPRGALALGLCLGGLAVAQPAFALPVTAATPRPQAGPAQSVARSARGPTVYGALQSLQRSGALTGEAYGEDSATYTEALSAAKRLTGTRRSELASVIANVQQIAAAGELIPSRLPALMLTLESNVQWWSHEPLPAAHQHVSVPGSHLVWEYYPGQGIEIQWLATFGAANGDYDNGHENTQLRELLEEAVPLATQRAGGIAWEYFFHFDGGAPPWTSGLSQGTALEALARAGARLKEPAFTEAAKRALGIFQTPPPAGVSVSQPAGTLYAEYTYAPTDRILNGFIQALDGLYEYAKLTGDPLGRQLFEAGDAEARAIVPSYDTGAWSKYDQYSESNLNYHELLTEFLEHLCKLTGEGPPPQPTPSASPAPASPSTPPTTSAGGVTATTSQTSAAIPGDAIYCTTAQRFTADLHAPPAIALLTRRLRGGARGGVQLSLSKIANLSLTISRGGRVVWTNSALVERGRPRLLWITPIRGGVYAVSVRAVDLAGNSATASGTIAVSAAAHG
jgi:D-glucuronyl C5-epimerase C-terminus